MDAGKKLVDDMKSKLSELRYSAETAPCSSIRIESKDMARGFGLAVHMLQLAKHSQPPIREGE